MITSRTAVFLAAAVALAPAGARGQPAVPQTTPAVPADVFKVDAPGVKASADLSWVATAGNSQTGTIGFGAELQRRWERQGLLFQASGIRASSSTGLNYAVGAVDNFEVVRPDPAATVEYYKVRGRYDYRITDRSFLLGGATWERNRFSGLRSRLVAEAGLGRVLAADEGTDLRVTASATYTHNEDVVPDPERENGFLGARLSWSLRQRLTTTAHLTHDAVLDENLSDTDDFRADLGLGLAVAMSSRLALKASYRLLLRNEPALELLPLRDAAGAGIGSVTAPLRKVDQGLSVSFVFSFQRSEGKPAGS